MHANPQPGVAFEAPTGPIPPRLNALKHGLRSEAILLPGDDGSEFRRRRLALFHTYLPQTEDEAECVETMAEMRWRLQRCRHVQAAYDAQVLALATDAAGRLSEPDGHQRLHSSMDCTVHQQRIDRMLCRARAKLVELQKLRRLGLVAWAAALPRGCYVDGSGAVLTTAPGALHRGPAAPRVQEVPVTASPAPANGSHDGGIGESSERALAAGKPPAGTHPAGLQSGPTRGRLIGGFGARRLFADPASGKALDISPRPRLSGVSS